MFYIQMFLFEYDMVTSYIEDFLALKCIAITELFYVIVSYHIYTSIYYLVYGKWSKQLAIFCNIYYETFKKVL